MASLPWPAANMARAWGRRATASHNLPCWCGPGRQSGCGVARIADALRRHELAGNFFAFIAAHGAARAASRRCLAEENQNESDDDIDAIALPDVRAHARGERLLRPRRKMPSLRHSFRRRSFFGGRPAPSFTATLGAKPLRAEGLLRWRVKRARSPLRARAPPVTVDAARVLFIHSGARRARGAAPQWAWL